MEKGLPIIEQQVQAQSYSRVKIVLEKDFKLKKDYILLASY